MNEDKVRELARNSMLETIKTNLDSGMIFTYIKSLEDRLYKAIEFITSYESIEEMQHNERIEDNKDLDKKTMVEMTRRYLIIHDKLLSILKGEDDGNR